MASTLRSQPFVPPDPDPTGGETRVAPPRPVDPGALHASVWRASQLGHGSTAALSSGFASLDAELPGNGWPLAMLTELIAREAGIGELRLMVPLMRQLTRERRTVLLLAPPHIPYAPALASFGVGDAPALRPWLRLGAEAAGPIRWRRRAEQSRRR